MTTRLPTHYKRELTMATMANYSAIVLIVSCPILSGYFCINAILSSGIPDALFSGLLSLLLIWLSPGPLITTYLYAQVYRYLHNRQAQRFEFLCSRVIRILDKLPVFKSSSNPTLLSLLAIAQLEQGHFKSAEATYRNALLQAQRSYGGRDTRWAPTVAILSTNLAVACIKQNNFVEADLLVDQAFEILKKANSQGLEILSTFPHLAASAIQYELNEITEAQHHAEMAMTTLQTASRPLQLRTAIIGSETQAILQLATLYIRNGNLAKANELCDQIINDCPSPLSTLSLKWLNLLATDYMNCQDFDRSERLVTMAYEIARDYPYHPDARPTLDCFEKQLLLTNRQAEVADMRSWLLPLDN